MLKQDLKNLVNLGDIYKHYQQPELYRVYNLINRLKTKIGKKMPLILSTLSMNNLLLLYYLAICR